MQAEKHRSALPCRLRSTAPRCPQVPFRRQELSQDTASRSTSHNWDPSEDVLFRVIVVVAVPGHAGGTLGPAPRPWRGWGTQGQGLQRAGRKLDLLQRGRHTPSCVGTDVLGWRSRLSSTARRGPRRRGRRVRRPLPGSNYREDGSDEPCVAEAAAAGDQPPPPMQHPACQQPPPRPLHERAFAVRRASMKAHDVLIIHIRA